ncbi:MAG: hypothetical protein WCK02_08375 [Bacteroidota bacterium]
MKILNPDNHNITMLSSSEIDLISDIIQKSKMKIDIQKQQDKFSLDFIEQSFLMENYDEIDFQNLYEIKDGSDYSGFSIIRVKYYIPNGKYNIGSNELQVIGFKKLDRDYGHILIRPETIGDTISEFFIKSELDFNEFPKFSSKYYFLSEEENKGYAFASMKRLEAIENQNEVYIEVKGNMLIAKFYRSLNSEDFENMIELIRNV